MAYKKKIEIEKEFVQMVLSKGGIKNYSCITEGKNTYYQLELKNGEVKYWNNLSTESFYKLGIRED